VVRQLLVDEFGEAIYDAWDTWRQLGYEDTKKQTAFYNANPALKQYSALKKQYDAYFNQRIVDVAKMLPSGMPSTIRTDEYTDVGTASRQQFAQMVQEPQADPSKILDTFDPTLRRLVMNYLQNGTELSYSAKNELDYHARTLGVYDGETLLQMLAVGLNP